MKSGTGLRLAAVGLIASLGFTAFAQTPPASAPQPTLIDAAAKDYGTRPVAYIYGNVPVTRAELAEFLIARGGYEKVELLVNKKIIESEAAKAGVSASEAELDAEFAKDLKGLDGITKKQFIEVVLSKYNKTYYEWMEDVVRPRLLLQKMCEKQVKVTDEDLLKEHERLHGEKRRVQIIIWPKNDDLKSITRVWDEIRKDEKEFDRVARQQANPALASTAGHVSPVGRNLQAEEKVIEERAFSMKAGDVSEIFQTSQGYMVMKCVGIVEANKTANFEDTKKTMHQTVFDLKLAQEIPKFFGKLKEKAQPQLLMSGPPSQWKHDKNNRDLADSVRDGMQVQPASSPPK